jgi:O-acetylhomoserine (thiol)-lyase
MSTQKFATNALHAGTMLLKLLEQERYLFKTSSYVFNNSEHASNLFSLSEPGFICPFK